MKSILKSKTFWFGVLQIVASGGALVASVFPPSAAIAGTASGVATIILRAVTSQPVSIPGVTVTPSAGANPS